MPSCIICLKDHESTTVEHIVPRALGNIHYVLRKGRVCKKCNNKFAKYEHAVLNSPQWFEQRKKKGLIRSRSDDQHHQAQQEAKAYELQRFLLKIFYESMYHSRRDVFEVLDLEHIRVELDQGKMVSRKIHKGKSISTGHSIPKFIDRWRLRQNGINLNYRVEKEAIFFEFCFYNLSNVVIIS